MKYSKELLKKFSNQIQLTSCPIEKEKLLIEERQFLKKRISELWQQVE